MDLPPAPFQKRIGLLSKPRTTYRRDDTTTSTYGNEITYTELDHKRDLYVLGTDESMQPTTAGERQQIVLIAYSTPSVDLRENDRIDYADERYEVLVRTGLPEDEDPALYRFELDVV